MQTKGGNSMQNSDNTFQENTVICIERLTIKEEIAEINRKTEDIRRNGEELKRELREIDEIGEEKQ